MLYALADCNNFFCSCERVFHPELEGRPVVVLSNNDGCIVARSNESKALGIKMGEPYFQIRPLLERHGVAVFSSNYNLYGDLSRRVMSMLSHFTPEIHVYSVDEAFLDFTGLQDPVAHARQLAHDIRKGVGIPMSVGIAPTKTLAKMASRFAKKYPAYKGVCMIGDDRQRERALQLTEVADLWGIGRRHARKLNSLGILTAYDLSCRDSEWVRRNLTVTGLRTWKELHGEDCIPPDELPHKKSICTSRSFPDLGLNRLGDLEEAVANFAAACARKLRSQQTVCSHMTVFAYTSRFREDLPFDFIQTSVAFDVPTADAGEMVAAAMKALRSQWKGEMMHYKKAGVYVWDISRDYAVQGSLFDTLDRPRHRRLMESVDAINRRLGDNTVRLAVQGYSRRWHLKCEYASRRYTTSIHDVLKVKP